MSEDIERTLLVKPEVFVYQIGPRASARGYRAADWNLAQPYWTGRLRCVSKGQHCQLRLEDKTSGELFAACPVEQYPGTAVEAVTDSSRYFVICVQDAGRKAWLGMGFSDRSDSFDLNVALQDHFKWVKKEAAFGQESTQPPPPKLDLAFKEGQTIKINIPKKEGSAMAKARPAAATGGGGGFLPPPPGGAGLGSAASAASQKPSSGGPPGPANLTPVQSPTGGGAAVDLLGLSTPNAAPAAASNSSAVTTAADDPWGDFASSSGSTTNASGNWVQF